MIEERDYELNNVFNVIVSAIVCQKCQLSNYFILYHDMGSVEISNQIFIVSVRLMMNKYMELNAGNCRYDMRIRGTTGMKL